ncbi:MAG: hypothetical protein E7390_00660 [Ruminococcaceae bacterium]|nr:hypothetical protein [Oscillospiraceae bacterium]
MKKFAVLIAILMALGSFPGAMAAEMNNLYTDESFETWNENRLAYWNGTNGMWGTALSQNTAYTKTDGSSLQMLPDAEKNVYVYQPADVIPGTEYAFSFWFLNMEGKTNNGNIEIAFEYRKADGKTSAGPSVKIKPEISESGAWQQLSACTETPMECEILRAVIHVYHPGGGYVDDAKLMQTSEPKHGEVSTDKIFYYKEEIQPDAMGEAAVTLNPYYAPEDFKASISWQDATGAWHESERKAFMADGTANLPYPLEGLTQVKKTYALKAHIYASNALNASAPLWSEEKAIYVYNRPLSLDENGNYRRIQYDTTGNPVKNGEAYVLEGEIFQPTLAYHVSQPKADTPKADNMYLQAQLAGVNVVQLSSYYADPGRIEAALDICMEYNLMALICLYRSNVPAGNTTELLKNSRGEYTTNADNTKEVVEIAKHHPATFAFAVKDEPFSHMTPTMYGDLENSYKIIRDTDDVHPVYIVDTADVKSLVKYADICAVDPYPKSTENSGTRVAIDTANAVEAANGEKPVYVILQAFCYGDADGNGTHDYFPTWKEVRHMWYQALSKGAKAVGYYAFDDPFGETGDKETTIDETSLWDGMTEFSKSEMHKSYDFFQNSTLLEQYESEAENGTAWSVQLRKKDGETFALILSKSSASQSQTTVQISPEKIREVSLGDGESVTDITGTSWILSLTGSNADVFRLREADMSLTQNGRLVSAVRAGASVRAEVTAEGMPGVKKSFVMAIYGANNKKKELLDCTIVADGDGTLQFSENIRLPEIPGATELKLLLLTSGFPSADFAVYSAKIE